MDNKPTQTQIGLLWHTLGLRPECRDSRHVYRNRFLAGPGHDDAPYLDALVALGLMGSRKPPAFCDQSEILYFATKEGERFAIAEMPPLPKRTKFEDYLDVGDCYENFAQFLGINKPQFQRRGEYSNREYRMVRYPWSSPYREFSSSYWSPYERLEVAGEWASTMKEAKASYKLALKEYRKRQNRPAKNLDQACSA
ncbi:hypothetical protein [Pseudomonas helleri]|uniref:hypothetical protein n=1 Tax=Pseudomonas helleri TaxID=1608996 RepID=UPI003FD4A601